MALQMMKMGKNIKIMQNFVPFTLLNRPRIDKNAPKYKKLLKAQCYTI